MSDNKRCIDCLLVNKVYDSCSKRECLESIEFAIEVCGDIDEYTFLYAEFGAAQVEPYECKPYFTEIDQCHAKLNAVVGVPIYAVLRRNYDNTTVTVEARPICNGVVQKDNLLRIPVNPTFELPREFVRQGRFTPYAESYVETGCATKICGDKLIMTLGFFIIVDAISPVQLKIPTFGFCDIPDEECDDPCEPDFCETFLNEDLTSFPTFFPSNVSTDGCNCD